MNARPDHTSVVAYMAHEANTATPERALALLQAMETRLASKGLTLAGVVEDAMYPHRRYGQLPRDKLANNTWRRWAIYLLSRRDELPKKDEHHLRVCYNQRSYLRKAQIRWIHDIVFRMEPAACGTWGAPD